MRLLFTTVLIALLQAGFAQTIAEDWTQTDCNGTEHQLYATLDTGTVVVMEIIMLDGCMPCINAAHRMQPIIDNYNALYNDRVHWYTFGYNDTYTCSELQTWREENSVNCTAQFIEGQDISAYYGGMGMPTIVVIGRNTHTVYFNQFGFVPADTTEFSNAIAYALGIAEPTVALNSVYAQSLSVQPNPTSDFVVVPNHLEGAQYVLVDISGRQVQSGQITDHSIDMLQLVSGMYWLTILDEHFSYRTQVVRL